MDTLIAFGWNDEWAQKWQVIQAPGLQPARVVADFGTSLRVALPAIETAELSGKLAHHSPEARQAVPKVGDWVAVRRSDNSPPVIEAVLPRRSELARKVAGKRTVKQVIAANIDIAFVLLSLDADFNVGRLQRYLYQLSADAIEPIIVLNKADATEEVAAFVAKLRDIAVPVVIASALDGSGVDDIEQLIKPGRTAILLGSSGVGKSTLTNRLFGRDIQTTQAVRVSDSAGRHTTVHRELFILAAGGLLVDTPGIRELQLWGTAQDLDENFDDIVALAAQCKYTTCRHGDEVGCAIRPALAAGVLNAAHLTNYQKMKHELVDLKKKYQVRGQLANKRSSKAMKKQSAQGRRELRDEMNER